MKTWVWCHLRKIARLFFPKSLVLSCTIQPVTCQRRGLTDSSGDLRRPRAGVQKRKLSLVYSWAPLSASQIATLAPTPTATYALYVGVRPPTKQPLLLTETFQGPLRELSLLCRDLSQWAEKLLAASVNLVRRLRHPFPEKYLYISNCHFTCGLWCSRLC